MTVLPDYLASGLRVVLCGTAPGVASAAARHYYAGPGNAFWSLLHESELVPEPMRPQDDARVLEFGIGLTDLVKTMAQSHDRGLPDDVAALDQRIGACSPEWLAFTSKTAGGAAARWAGERPPSLGRQEWTIGGARVFVLPSPSGRNQGRASDDGRDTRLEWWSELARIAEDERAAPPAHRPPGR